MNCKYCQHPLEDGNSVCPGCGKDNAVEMQEEVTAQEETLQTAEEVMDQPVQEQPEKEPEAAQPQKGIVLTPGKLALIIGSVVVLTAVVVALILYGMGYSFTKAPEETTIPAETVPVATVPADGNPDDVTCQGSYTASDEEVIAAMNTVVATAGDGQLTNGQLQIYYWMQVQNFIANYGGYASYYGLDIYQPLDTQICMLSEEGLTWQQYFLRAALESWHNYQSMANEAAGAGYELDESYQADIAAIPESLATDAGLQGFDSAESYLAYNVGAGATIEDYMHYMEVYYQGYLYFQAEYEKMQPTEEELKAYFTEHEAEYAANGITMDSNSVNIRHILILPEGATVDTIYTETFPEEAWAAGEKKAQEILDQWLAGEASETSFANFANANSADPGSNTNGGLYEDVMQGEMVEAFDAWCFDAARQIGDYGIVRTELGFHIMYFSGRTPIWQDYAMSDLLNERASNMMLESMDKYPVEVDYSAIKIGYVNMAA